MPKQSAPFAMLAGMLVVLPLCYAPHSDPAPAYSFDRPQASHELPKALKEISGLTALDDRRLAAVQDEEGRLYVLDVETGAVESVRTFGKAGDYEGVERAGDRLFVLRSDGTLYEIEGWQHEGKLKTKRYKTPLSAKCDAEGLAYDGASHRLLIACKEQAGKGLKDQKAVYAFDLRREALLPDPVFTVDLAAGLQDFKPSGLAVHPITRQVYVLSSVLKALVVLEPDGRVADLSVLPASLFEQPEGLAFLPNGDLFIASEGVRREAALLRFNYMR